MKAMVIANSVSRGLLAQRSEINRLKAERYSILARGICPDTQRKV